MRRGEENFKRSNRSELCVCGNEAALSRSSSNSSHVWKPDCAACTLFRSASKRLLLLLQLQLSPLAWLRLNCYYNCESRQRLAASDGWTEANICWVQKLLLPTSFPSKLVAALKRTNLCFPPLRKSSRTAKEQRRRRRTFWSCLVVIIRHLKFAALSDCFATKRNKFFARHGVDSNAVVGYWAGIALKNAC